MIKCNKCGKENVEGSLICENEKCSEPLIPSCDTNRCGFCGSEISPADEFCTSCGNSTRSNNDAQEQQPQNFNSRTLTLENGTVLAVVAEGDSKLIGRNSDECDISVAEMPNADFISRKQLRVLAETDGFECEDLRSSNNTFIDGNIIPPGTKVKAGIGSKIELAGKITLIVG